MGMAFKQIFTVSRRDGLTHSPAGLLSYQFHPRLAHSSRRARRVSCIGLHPMHHLTPSTVDRCPKNPTVSSLSFPGRFSTLTIRLSIVRLIAMVLPTTMFYFGGVYLSLDIFRACGYRAPFRISSTPQGSIMPTAMYVMIEDIVAVDGGGGQIYRYALRTRYLSSPYFRRMLFEMNCFWAGGSIVCAAAMTAVIFTVSEPVAFTVSPMSTRDSSGKLILCSWDGPSPSPGQEYGF